MPSEQAHKSINFLIGGIRNLMPPGIDFSGKIEADKWEMSAHHSIGSLFQLFPECRTLLINEKSFGTGFAIYYPQKQSSRIQLRSSKITIHTWL